MKIINHEQGSPSWLAWRRQGIGSSDIAAICGICPYRTRTDVMREKLGFGQTFVNPAMERGKKYEAEARNLYNETAGTKFVPLCIEHEKHPYFIASLDGYYKGKILEIKVPGKKTIDLVKLNKIPDYYRFQIHWQLYVSGAHEGIYCVYDPETGGMWNLNVEEDSNLQENLIDEADRFYLDLEIGNFQEPEKKEVKTEQNYRLCEMFELKQSIKNLQKQYDDHLAEFIQVYGNENSIVGAAYMLARSERITTNYKHAAEIWCPEDTLKTFQNEPSVSFTIKKVKDDL
jgi:putative phage-type endonuclease